MRRITPEQATAQNEINAIANEVEGHLIRLLSDWQQKKAVKISGYGGFVQKLKAQLEEYYASHGYNVEGGNLWVSVCRFYTSIIASVRILKTGQKVEMYLARVDEETGVLTQIHECKQRRTDYTAEDVNAVFAEADRLEAEARDLRNSVRDFH